MLQSMTGFGRSEFNLGDYVCSLEIRSLNGKQFELNSKIPSILKLYEINLGIMWNPVQPHVWRYARPSRNSAPRIYEAHSNTQINIYYDILGNVFFFLYYSNNSTMWKKSLNSKTFYQNLS